MVRADEIELPDTSWTSTTHPAIATKVLLAWRTATSRSTATSLLRIDRRTSAAFAMRKGWPNAHAMQRYGGGGGVQPSGVMGAPGEHDCITQAPAMHWPSKVQAEPLGSRAAHMPDVGDVVSHHVAMHSSSWMHAPPTATLDWQVPDVPQ